VGGKRPDEAFGIALEGPTKQRLALVDNLTGSALVKHLWGEQAGAAVVVLRVVPGEEDLAEGAGVLHAWCVKPPGHSPDNSAPPFDIAGWPR